MNTSNTSTAVLLVIALAIVVGGFLYYQHDQNTATIDLPGDARIEIRE